MIQRSYATYPSLRDKRAFVTGGATGIGAALVERFAANGAITGFNDLDEASGDALAVRLGDAVSFHAADASDPQALAASVAAFAERAGGIDILVNNVANDVRHKIEDVTPDFWRRNLAVNLDPVFFASQAALPHLRAAGGGSIVNLGSINAYLGPADIAVYTAAKAGIIGLTRSLARALGPDRIRVNALMPGWITTEKQKRLWLTPEAETAWRELCALKDPILPDDVAALALFLAADDSAMITGQELIIDAGRV